MARPFDPSDAVLFEQFSAHLMQHWSTRVAALIDDSGALGEKQGLVDAAGGVVHLGAQLALLLHERFPNWDGTRLPEGLTGASLDTHAILKVGDRRLTVERCG